MTSHIAQMCLNQLCPSKKLCARHTSSGTKTSVAQSWAMFSPKGQTCENFIEQNSKELAK